MRLRPLASVMLLAALSLSAASPPWGDRAANAQSAVVQSGAPAPGQVPVYSLGGWGQAVISAAGPASGGVAGQGVNEPLQMNRGAALQQPPFGGTGSGPYGTHDCRYSNATSGPQSANGGYYLCLDADIDGKPTIAVGSFGATAWSGLQFLIQGTPYPYPGTGDGIVGPNTAVDTDLVAFSGTTGHLVADAGLSLGGLATDRVVVALPSGRAGQSPTDLATILTPGGLYVPSSTTSDGLQEALNWASPLTEPGLSVDVYGPGGANPNYYVTSGTVNIPAMRNSGVWLHGTEIANTLGSLPAVTLDTMADGSYFRADASQIFTCVVTCGVSGAGSALLLQPESTDPIEGFVGIAGSDLALGTLSINTSGGLVDAVAKLNTFYGGIVNNKIDLREATGNGAISGSFATDAVQWTRGGSSGIGSLSQNRITLGPIHNYLGVGLHVGTSATDAGWAFANRWDFSSISGGGPSSIAVDTWENSGTYSGFVDDIFGLLSCFQIEASGEYNVVDIRCYDNSGAGITNGVVLEPGASYNAINLISSGTVTNPIVDDSGEPNSYTVNGLVWQKFDNGGYQYNYQPIASISVSGCTGATEVFVPTNSEGTLNLGTSCSANPTITINFSHPAGMASGNAFLYKALASSTAFNSPGLTATQSTIAVADAVFAVAGTPPNGTLFTYTIRGVPTL
jgi:hypothetical protein